jgi:hypothetical protein
MTDRELLECAAKAAGIEGEFKDHGGVLWLSRNDFGSPWNPITDDGDALRLAVKLRINVEHAETLGRQLYGVNCWPVGRGDCGYMETDLSDPYAATRRAIVRAAAEIGRRIAQQTARADLPEDNYYKTMAEAEETGRTAAEIGRQMTCPECEYHKQRANRWRHEAYRQGGTPLPWSPDEVLLKQALAFTMRDFATVRDFEAARAVLHDALHERLKEKE